MISQDEAVQVLEEGYGKVHALIDRLPAGSLTQPGIGGDKWTAQDLIGHIAFWENAALEALDAAVANGLWERHQFGYGRLASVETRIKTCYLRHGG